ncbi:hypothetical protein DAPPUDRAFT_233150 [Daphnia pulex]|uniref:Uncharacterized protein n=1 Tax=Daphnia pulex TaxID=6669 RepID=E9FTD2_DAPPU|nr:hypothetical protein DAPPUDRAFT_233150 [Daphnia pulex]|eukprot:EFX89345.1 hypothetical protein DAPPUDRAFT_233150 [Daphnia pulex]
MLSCTIVFPATTTKNQPVTSPKRPSTALQPTLPQLTSRRHRSTPLRRHRHVKPRLQFTALQPTLLQSTTPTRHASMTPPLTILPPTSPKLRKYNSALSYYTTKAAEYYTTNYDSAIRNL